MLKFAENIAGFRARVRILGAIFRPRVAPILKPEPAAAVGAGLVDASLVPTGVAAPFQGAAARS